MVLPHPRPLRLCADHAARRIIPGRAAGGSPSISPSISSISPSAKGWAPTLAPGGPQPDVLNFAWRDYGNRVGAWRLLRTARRTDACRAAPSTNAAIFDYCPELPAAFAARGDEIVAHGRSNSERQGDLDEADEAS